VDRRIFGRDEVQGEILETLATFPDLRLQLDDIICQERDDGQHTSTRWTLFGTNSGTSVFGPPSNRSVRLTGITNHCIRGSRLYEGWTQYNVLSLLRQIAPIGEAATEGNGDE
jgi:predicted ester cyclase